MTDPVPYQSFLECARQDPPRVAVILGSGLHALARRIEPVAAIDYADIPDMPATTVAGHPGRLTLGTWTGVRVLVFEGRLHRYEGHRAERIARPARISRELGASILLATNSAGGIAGALVPPCLLAVTDHMDCARPFFWRALATGQQPARPNPYSRALLEMVQRAAADLAIPLGQGVYAQVTGPNYETPAEIRALKAMGADVVGMSTVSEIDAARELGLECAAISAVTNRAAGLSNHPLTHQEVLGNAAALEKPMGDLLERFLAMV